MAKRPEQLQRKLNAVYDQLNQIDREAQEQMRNYLTAMSRTGRRAALLQLQRLARALRPAVKLTTVAPRRACGGLRSYSRMCEPISTSERRRP